MRPSNTALAPRLLRWQRQHGRHDLPWQHTDDPYRVWLSEIMLQQTQVATVVPYYARFLARFPDVATLAGADVGEVMALWSGLGYYARARNLHACARQVMALPDGRFPRDAEALAALPGIGRSTAHAIAAACFGARTPILDGNVKRVFCRHFLIEGVPGTAAIEQQLWALAHQQVPAQNVAVWNQALMDLGATLCTRSRPRCTACPLADTCAALAAGRVDELPQRKARAALPRRAATLLLVLDARNRVLLETRPPRGIWGGMQCLPELPADESPEAWVARVLCTAPGGIVGAVSPRLCFEHTFTHFRLAITPLVLRVQGVTRQLPQGHWLHLDEALAAALPTPVRRILGDFIEQPHGGAP